MDCGKTFQNSLLIYLDSNLISDTSFRLALKSLILAPLAATLLKAAISRKREALADATAVSFTRNPAGLRAALEVLARDNTVVQARSSAVAHMYIESPLDASAASRLFATHPPIQERIETLRRMEANPSQ